MHPIFGPKMPLFLGYRGNGESFFSKISFFAKPDARLTFDINFFVHIKRYSKMGQYHPKKVFFKLQHDNLIEVLCTLVDFVFNGGRKTPDGCRKYLTVKGKSCFFFYKKETQHQLH